MHLRECQAAAVLGRVTRSRFTSTAAVRSVPPPPGAWAWLLAADFSAAESPWGVSLFRYIPRAALSDFRRCCALPLSRVAANAEDVAAWRLFLLTPRLLLHHAQAGGLREVHALRVRCQWYLAGEWEGLGEEYLAAAASCSPRSLTTPAAPEPASPVDELLPDERRRRCLRFARVEKLSNAAQAMSSSPPAPVTAATLEALRDLHLVARHPLPDWVADFSPSAALHLPAERSPALPARLQGAFGVAL